MTVRTFLTDEDIEKYCASFDKKTIWIDTSPDTRGVFCFKMLTPSNLFIRVDGYKFYTAPLLDAFQSMLVSVTVEKSGWIWDEVIKRREKKGQVITMASPPNLNPSVFDIEEWLKTHPEDKNTKKTAAQIQEERIAEIREYFMRYDKA